MECVEKKINNNLTLLIALPLRPDAPVEAWPIMIKETRKNIRIPPPPQKKKNKNKTEITFALVADVAVILWNDIAGRVLHERLVNNLFVVVGSLLLPQSAQAGRSKGTGVSR